jgi:hypothetical protein
MEKIEMNYQVYAKYKQKVIGMDNLENWKSDLSIDSGNGLQISYAPFDYVNLNAKVVIVGITPGEQQAMNALNTLRSSLKSGLSDLEALKAAKKFGSFSGPMRSNLIKMLDHIGFPQLIDVASCSEFFEEESEAAHFTSVLKYPVFYNDSNYSGNPPPKREPLLSISIQHHFLEEVKLLPDAVYIPLGKLPTETLLEISKQGYLGENQILDGIPHPSGANSERVSYFVGDKRAADCSPKTNPVKLDEAKTRLIEKLGLDVFVSGVSIHQ